MFATHDHIEEIECFYCKGKVPYYEIEEALGKPICEYCLDEMYAPQDI